MELNCNDVCTYNTRPFRRGGISGLKQEHATWPRGKGRKRAGGKDDPRYPFDYTGKLINGTVESPTGGPARNTGRLVLHQ